MAERWYAKLSRFFSHKLSSRQPLVLYATGPDFRQTNTIEGDIGEGTGGVTEPYKRRVILPFGASLAETDHVLGHELVHAFQYDITATSARGAAAGSGLERLPLWFVEGMAEYVSLGPIDPNTAMWMRDAVQQDKLPTIKKLNDPKYFPYRWGQAFWAYVAGRWGDRMVADLLSAAAATGDVNLTMEKLLGVKPEDLSGQWQAALKSEYVPLAKATRPNLEYGRLLVPAKSLGQDLNVSPALSPDGKQMLFLSSRGLFSIDLYLADAETGKAARRIIGTATSPHWSSLQFIASAGDWGADGKHFVFAAVTDATPELAFLDVDAGRVEREIKFPKLGEIFSPSWSRDGRYIAFSANVGGLTDLYVYDLKTATLKQLTNDAYADLQPAWSPDGQKIAFVTDRFSTDLANLKPGNYRLALIDPKTGAIEKVPGFDAAKNINPQWSSDGTLLYFASDRNGISNIYQMTVATGAIAQVTNLYTGVSGITDLSPTFSVASKTNAMAFSVFDDQKYEIIATAPGQTLTTTEPVSLPGPASILPPPNQRAGDWPAMLQNADLGLPSADTNYQVDNYKSKLALDFVGQPYVGVGVDTFGTYAGGGVSFLWSDMLGNHTLATSLQVSSGFNNRFSDIFKDSGGFLAYQDLSHRWNWGLSVEQFPYLQVGFNEGFNQAGEIEQDSIVFRQVNRTAAANVAYPFNRAQRVEFGVGFSNVSFSQETRTTTFDPITGQLLSDQTQTSSLANSLNLAQGSAALVYDTSIWGATSPIRGQSYRAQFMPTTGTINYNTLLLDYRRYMMPAQLYTIAGRVLHYGRYGSASDDTRLIPLFIGYPQLVRGYDIGSFTAAECGPDLALTGACPAFDRLVGSRMLVGNLEFRFPLLRPFGLRRGVYGPVPVELAFFADGGVTWSAGTKPFQGDRRAVTSAGVAWRVNVFGFAVLEFDVAHPFQRPGKGWTFQWSFSPGGF
jgi:Tol biopolymer transport system component